MTWPCNVESNDLQVRAVRVRGRLRREEQTPGVRGRSLIWRMASGKADEMTDDRLACIKQEDCQWGAPEGPSVKVEECEVRISVLKEEEGECKIADIKSEDSEDFLVTLELQKHETGSVFKEGGCGEFHSSALPRVTKMGQPATCENSLEMKDRLFGLEEKIKEGKGRREEKEQQSCRSVEINFQEKDIFFPPSSAQTSLKCQLEQTQDNENEMRSTIRSACLPPGSFQDTCLPAAKKVKTETINSEHLHVHNTNQEALLQHNSNSNDQKWTETRPKPYACSECGKLFSHSNSLHRHKKIHTGEIPYCCPECGKRFLQMSSLKSHTRIHTGEKPYCCSECGKRFLQKCHLQDHVRIHSGEKPYCCTECGKQFLQVSHLQSHIRIHTGEKPHCCAECGKLFSHRSGLYSHKIIHTGEKPHCCCECVKRFSNSSKLNRHMRVHIRETNKPNEV
ncbi:zinc finger protein 502-like [Polypterus senegalus]|uniref:zinc finger protein 502-like n=1 Tax=Polypterus senegalus TaxID=55291 RepID=UPI0019645750|nr:zinc finger protein 502-like [Polypterus senegalus]XP_039608365.1 zinc finger protein 502-like [Polypterus senegalus]